MGYRLLSSATLAPLVYKLQHLKEKQYQNYAKSGKFAH